MENTGQYITVFNKNKKPIGLIPANVPIKMEGLSLLAGDKDIAFPLDEIVIEDHNSEMAKMINQWIECAKKLVEMREYREKKIEELKKALDNLGSIKIKEKYKTCSPLYEKYWNQGLRRVHNDHTFSSSSILWCEYRDDSFYIRWDDVPSKSEVDLIEDLLQLATQRPWEKKK